MEQLSNQIIIGNELLPVYLTKQAELEGRYYNTIVKFYPHQTKVTWLKNTVEPKKKKNIVLKNQDELKKTSKTVTQDKDEEELNEDKEPKEYSEEYVRQQKSRIYQRIFDLVMCNDFDYFATLTIAPDNQYMDATNLEEVRKKVAKRFDNYKQQHSLDFKYILFFEPHKKGGRWHMHALLRGLKEEHIRKAIDPNNGEELTYTHKSGSVVPKENWTWWDPIGFTSLIGLDGKVGKDQLASYVTKYITKYMTTSFLRGSQLYLRSKKLLKPEEQRALFSKEEYLMLGVVTNVEAKEFDWVYSFTLKDTSKTDFFEKFVYYIDVLKAIDLSERNEEDIVVRSVIIPNKTDLSELTLEECMKPLMRECPTQASSPDEKKHLRTTLGSKFKELPNISDCEYNVQTGEYTDKELYRYLSLDNFEHFSKKYYKKL